jgi:hypothetical protein
MVCICSLRTQQRAKSQCIKHIPPSMGWPPFLGVALSTDLYVKIAELVWSFGAGLVWHSRMFTVRMVLTCEGWLAVVYKAFNGEFDPGSGRTLAACLTHASRAERPFGVLERRTGE